MGRIEAVAGGCGRAQFEACRLKREDGKAVYWRETCSLENIFCSHHPAHDCLDIRRLVPPYNPPFSTSKPDRSPLGFDSARKLGAEPRIKVIKLVVGDVIGADFGVIVLLEGCDGLS